MRVQAIAAALERSQPQFHRLMNVLHPSWLPRALGCQLDEAQASSKGGLGQVVLRVTLDRSLGFATKLLAVMLPCLTAMVPLARASAQNGTAVELLAHGVQIYTCAATPTGVAWKLKAPEATLRDSSGHVAGQHFAGPTWQATDGSKVVGVPLVASIAQGPAGIPWLVLRATDNDGTGMFARVAYIARTRTIGGLAPAKGCDPAHPDAEIRVPYSATYTFFSAAAP